MGFSELRLSILLINTLLSLLNEFKQGFGFFMPLATSFLLQRKDASLVIRIIALYLLQALLNTLYRIVNVNSALIKITSKNLPV